MLPINWDQLAALFPHSRPIERVKWLIKFSSLDQMTRVSSTASVKTRKSLANNRGGAEPTTLECNFRAKLTLAGRHLSPVTQISHSLRRRIVSTSEEMAIILIRLIFFLLLTQDNTIRSAFFSLAHHETFNPKAVTSPVCVL